MMAKATATATTLKLPLVVLFFVVVLITINTLLQSSTPLSSTPPLSTTTATDDRQAMDSASSHQSEEFVLDRQEEEYYDTFFPASTPASTSPSWALGGFVRAEINPIISPRRTKWYDPLTEQTIEWESNDTFNPAAIVKDGRIHVLYRAEDQRSQELGYRTSRVGHAVMAAGSGEKVETRYHAPVLYPNPADDYATIAQYEIPGGLEDVRVAETAEGLYVAFYTAWNQKNARLGVATSKNLTHWEKHGPIFRKNKHLPQLHSMWHKSASILTELDEKKQRLIISKVDMSTIPAGMWKREESILNNNPMKYFMYFGENWVSAAVSDNLKDWEPLMHPTSSLDQLYTIALPRRGYFDSALVECGPPAIRRGSNIVLIYNGKNHNNATYADPNFPLGAYTAGQMLLSGSNPTEVLNLLDKPFFRPMMPFEKTGQYEYGTVFIQSLVYYLNKFWVYYGCADSHVAVAVFDPQDAAPFDPLPNVGGDDLIAGSVHNTGSRRGSRESTSSSHSSSLLPHNTAEFDGPVANLD